MVLPGKRTARCCPGMLGCRRGWARSQRRGGICHAKDCAPRPRTHRRAAAPWDSPLSHKTLHREGQLRQPGREFQLRPLFAAMEALRIPGLAGVQALPPLKQYYLPGLILAQAGQSLACDNNGGVSADGAFGVRSLWCAFACAG